MFVVMARTATEAEILGVKSHILAEGMTPVRPRRPGAGRHRRRRRGGTAQAGTHEPPGGPAGRRDDHPDLAAVQADLARVPPRGHRHPRPRRGDRRRRADGDGRALLRGEPRSADGDGGRGRRPRARPSCAAARSSRGRRPTAFQGLGVEALRYLAEARDRTGLPTITEVMEPNQVDIVAEYADILQIGARNMQNYSLLNAAGRVARPVMLKRGFGATIEELLMAAEYIVGGGQPERDPVRAGHPDVRDLHPEHPGPGGRSAPPPPDPPAGDRGPQPRDREALAGQAAGDRRRGGRRRRGHGRGSPEPEEALSDAEQQLNPAQFADLMAALVPVHEHVRSLHGDPLVTGAALGIGAGGLSKH